MLQRTDFFTGLPRRYFGAILIDVPLHFETWSAKGEGRSASRHYRVMTFEQSLTLPVGDLAADDAWIFSWLPAPFIPRIGEQMEAWNFEYSSKAFCWAKLNKKRPTPFMGGGHTTRKGSEDCFLGRRGSPRRNSAGVYELIIAPVREHSRKPDEVYERIEEYCDGPYLELFARTQRPGWTAWGDQVGMFTGAAER
ncbi:MAG: MT-A70 family methyltransferase [Xanthobacteraceae bacterium]|jgi:N6-adenosine-specific RNA methylase IME4